MIATAELIAAAQRRVWLVQFVIDARPEEDGALAVRSLLNALAAAVRRGVDVRVVLPVIDRDVGRSGDDNAPAAAYLAARGVSVRHYAPTRLRPFLHAKYVLVDEGIAVVSSANWTPRALILNVEVGVTMTSPTLVAELATRFERLWGTSSSNSAEKSGTDESKVSSPRDFGNAAHCPTNALALRGSGDDGYGASPGGVATVLSGQPYVRRLVDEISRARSRVWVSMFGLAAARTRRLRDLVAALGAAHKRGVDVRVLYDARGDFRNVWAVDAHAFAAAGIPAHPWPLLTRMHARAVVIDRSHAFIGSVGWTPQSVFRTEELTLHLVQAGITEAVAKHFERWWDLAGGWPSTWPVEVLLLSESNARQLRAAGVAALADLHSPAATRGLDSAMLRELRIASAWVERHRFAPPLARLLAHRAITSLGGLRTMSRPSDIDGALQTGTYCGGILKGVAGTYLRRRIDNKEV